MLDIMETPSGGSLGMAFIKGRELGGGNIPQVLLAHKPGMTFYGESAHDLTSHSDHGLSVFELIPQFR